MLLDREPLKLSNIRNKGHVEFTKEFDDFTADNGGGKNIRNRSKRCTIRK